MKYLYSFEKLTVWHDAKNLALDIYKATDSFPDNEKYGLVSQMRRCAISVCSNISEGSARKTNKDQAHFYTMAYGSLLELLNQCIISNELSYLTNDKYKEIREVIEKISNKTNGLRRNLDS